MVRSWPSDELRWCAACRVRISVGSLTQPKRPAKYPTSTPRADPAGKAARPEERAEDARSSQSTRDTDDEVREVRLPRGGCAEAETQTLSNSTGAPQDNPKQRT